MILNFNFAKVAARRTGCGKGQAGRPGAFGGGNSGNFSKKHPVSAAGNRVLLKMFWERGG